MWCCSQSPLSSPWHRRESVKGRTIPGYKGYWKRTQNGDGEGWKILYSHDASLDLSKELLLREKNDKAVEKLKPNFAIFEYALVFSRKGKIDTEFSPKTTKFKVFCGRTENAQAYFNSQQWVDENYGYIKIALQGENTPGGKPNAKLKGRKRALIFRVGYGDKRWDVERAQDSFLTSADYAWNEKTNPPARAVYLDSRTRFCCMHSTVLKTLPSTPVKRFEGRETIEPPSAPQAPYWSIAIANRMTPDKYSNPKYKSICDEKLKRYFPKSYDHEDKTTKIRYLAELAYSIDSKTGAKEETNIPSWLQHIDIMSPKWSNELLYNDEKPPLPPRWNPNGETESGGGHAKGVIVWNASKIGWLVHSVPKWPMNRNNMSAEYTDLLKERPRDNTHHQSFVWVEIDFSTKALQDILLQLYFMGVHDYPSNTLQNCFSQLSPRSISLASGIEHVGKHPLPVESFYKILQREYQGGRDDELLVNSWINGEQKISDRKLSNMAIEFDPYWKWPADKDHLKDDHSHAKLAVSNILACVGDLNNVDTQCKRGGGGIIIRDPKAIKFLQGFLTIDSYGEKTHK